ncbi:hypothetical protein CFBP5877_06840 [Agrobacterium tumefaciens]|uniref:Uncharacterized protein n=1 Tax=Agrobacterium tumefaciens TaxID=358 RepID=A0AAE6B9Q4_AGRTU|nr:hypothetical protein CFBP5499_07310 [Agrobacterium tumefaciens]QCL78820.1 hypothetical protein CFBP5877_06840 [Agrobacterium tumefaciens]
MAEVVLALRHIELLAGIFKRGVPLAIWFPGRHVYSRAHHETVIGTRSAYFRYRSWKEACHAAETL